MRVAVWLIYFLACLELFLVAGIPSLSPEKFRIDEEVFITANTISSHKNAVQYNYYDLPLCSNHHKKLPKVSNIGDSLTGKVDNSRSSPYDLHMHSNIVCQTLCYRSYKEKELALFRQIIADDYYVHWKLDDLPVAVRTHEVTIGDYVVRGYPVGFRYKIKDEDGQLHSKHYLYNHVRITVRVNLKEEQYEDGYHIVGFEVIPMSIRHEFVKDSDTTKENEESTFNPEKASLSTCNANVHAEESSDPNLWQSVEGKEENIVYTYDVKWEQSDIQWSNRWDIYMHANPNAEIRYFSLLNSLIVVLFISGIIAIILIRTLRKDISKYNKMAHHSDIEKDNALVDGKHKHELKGWKFIHGNVFQPPKRGAMLLSALVGSGVQLLGMLVSFIIFSMLGLTAPEQRSWLLSAMLFLFIFMGSIAGYTSARIYKFFDGKFLLQATSCTSLIYPGVMGSLFVATNLLISSLGSTVTVPVNTILLLLLLWIGVSTPLIFTGAYFGYSRKKITVPVRTSKERRYIPRDPWYWSSVCAVCLGGIIPFSAVYIELSIIMSAMWLDQIYVVFWLLFIVLFILIITCAEISVVTCYFQLCTEDYEWQWRSYLSSGCSALYMFVYICWYYHSQLQISGYISSLIYFSYAIMSSMTFFVLTGSIGFLACLNFNRLIYSSIKID